MSWMRYFDKIVSHSLRKMPLNSSTEIRLTHLCTQRCRQCSVYERTTEPAIMSLENFKILARRLRDYGAFVGFISGGEATLVPHLEEILLEAKRTFSLATTLVTGLYNKTEIIERVGEIALKNDINIQTSLDGFGELGDHLRGVPHFADTVLKHMKLLSQMRGDSKSLLYANIVLNNLNLEQVPELIRRARDLGWMTTIGMYHTLTATTRKNEDMRLQPGERLNKLLDFLENNDDILNLNSYIRGIRPFVEGQPPGVCAFVDSPVLSTRTTIMEDGAVHLCYGPAIGNIFESSLEEIFSGECYKALLDSYRKCEGCWTTCYTQRYLVTHPKSIKEFRENIHKLRLTRRR